MAASPIISELAEPLWLLSGTAGPWKRPLNDYLRADSELRRITVLSANARSDPDAEIPDDDDPPSMLDTALAVIGGAIDRRSTGLLAQAALSGPGFVDDFNEIRSDAHQIDYMWADLAFDRLTDPACARRFSNLPTDWALDRHEVDALILLGAALTFATGAYQDQALASGATSTPAAMSAVADRFATAACACLSGAGRSACSTAIDVPPQRSMGIGL